MRWGLLVNTSKKWYLQHLVIQHNGFWGKPETQHHKINLKCISQIRISYVSTFSGLHSTHIPHDTCNGGNQHFGHKYVGSHAPENMYLNLRRDIHTDNGHVTDTNKVTDYAIMTMHSVLQVQESKSPYFLLFQSNFKINFPIIQNNLRESDVCMSTAQGFFNYWCSN